MHVQLQMTLVKCEMNYYSKEVFRTNFLKEERERVELAKDLINFKKKRELQFGIYTYD